MKSREFSHKRGAATPVYIRWSLRLSIIGALVAIVLAVPLLNIEPSAEQVNWANPTSTTFKQVAAKIDASSTDQPSYLSNLNCVEYTFRYRGDSTMQNGCFTAAAFGSMDVNSHAVIFNGTDEAVRVEPAGSGFSLPLPRSAVVANLAPAPLAGSYLNFYTYFPNVLSDVWDDLHLNVAYKQVTGAANLHFTDLNGQQLPVNPESIAFSSNGAWMVVESPWHSFMRVNLATFDMLPFAPSFNGQSFDTDMHTSQVSISDDGRYAAVQSDESPSFKVYDLSTCVGVITNDLKPISCASHDYQQTIHSSVPGYSHVTKVRFITDAELSVNVAYTEGTGTSATSSIDSYILSPSQQIGALTNYLALGDSYTAGEGSFNYESGTDLPFNRCHLSAHSYPLLLSQDVFHGDGHSVACSGARIHDLDDASGGYPGQVSDGIARKARTDDSVSALINQYSPGYIAQYEFAEHYQPKVLTVSVGGNDMGFADILKNCAVTSIQVSTCYDSYEARKEVTDTIDSQLKPLVNLYKMLQEDAPLSSIYAIGYPQILSDGGSCALNVHMDAKEIEFAQEVTDYINAEVKQAAAAAGIQYVDISQALYGHRLCEAKSYDVAVNGLTAGTDDGPWGTRVFGSESYHPTALGQELIEQTILGQTKNFTLPVVHPDPSKTVVSKPASNAPILSVPKTGRATHTVISGQNITSPVVSRGKKVIVKVSGTQSGFQPNTTGTISVGGVVVGSFVADNEGNAQSDITIPPSQSPGSQAITVTGQGQDDQPVDVTQPIYVSSSDADTDGDGIDDDKDSCPGVTNSIHDDDGDGIDDACDGYIGSGPTQGNSGSGTSTGDDQTGAGGSATPSDSNDDTPNGAGDNATVISVNTDLLFLTEGEPSPPTTDQGFVTISNNSANAVNTSENSGLDTAADIAEFDESDLADSLDFSDIDMSDVPLQAVTSFSQVPKQSSQVHLRPALPPGFSLNGLSKVSPLQPSLRGVPRTPLASIGSVIRFPFHFMFLKVWWWAAILFMMLIALLGYLFRRRLVRIQIARSILVGARILPGDRRTIGHITHHTSPQPHNVCVNKITQPLS